MTLVEGEKFSLTLTVPVTLGLNVDDYYQNAAGSQRQTGFFDIGVDLSAPLSCVSSRFGSWELNAGVHFLFLGTRTARLNNNDDSEVIGAMGIGIGF